MILMKKCCRLDHPSPVHIYLEHVSRRFVNTCDLKETTDFRKAPLASLDDYRVPFFINKKLIGHCPCGKKGTTTERFGINATNGNLTKHFTRAIIPIKLTIWNV